jgi:hypothetical protein
LASWVFKEKLFKEDLQNGLEYNGKRVRRDLNPDLWLRRPEG